MQIVLTTIVKEYTILQYFSGEYQFSQMNTKLEATEVLVP